MVKPTHWVSPRCHRDWPTCAIQEGRFSDAVPILERGAEADLKADNREKAAAKFAALAHAHVLRQQKAAAIAAADKALANDNAVKIRFLAGRIFVEAGDIKRRAERSSPNSRRKFTPSRKPTQKSSKAGSR